MLKEVKKWVILKFLIHPRRPLRRFFCRRLHFVSPDREWVWRSDHLAGHHRSLWSKGEEGSVETELISSSRDEWKASSLLRVRWVALRSHEFTMSHPSFSHGSFSSRFQSLRNYVWTEIENSEGILNHVFYECALPRSISLCPSFVRSLAPTASSERNDCRACGKWRWHWHWCWWIRLQIKGKVIVPSISTKTQVLVRHQSTLWFHPWSLSESDAVLPAPGRKRGGSPTRVGREDPGETGSSGWPFSGEYTRPRLGFPTHRKPGQMRDKTAVEGHSHLYSGCGYGWANGHPRSPAPRHLGPSPTG